jgi:hypothetical protein
MPRPAAVIRLTPQEQKTLKQYLRSGTTEQRLVERARVILLAHQGQSTEAIARSLNTPTRTRLEMAAAFCETSTRGLGR